MKSEQTIFDPKSDPRLSNLTANPYEDNINKEVAASTEMPVIAKVGAAGASGLLIGAAAMALSSYTTADQALTAEEELSAMTDEEFEELEVEEDTDIEEEEVEEELEEINDVNTSDVTDGNVAFAAGVNDNMSFAQAFAAARSEVGAGGAFVWHGNIYGTYTATEWNSMPPAQQQAYSSHFNWNNIERPTTSTSTNTAPAHSAGQQHSGEEEHHHEEEQQHERENKGSNNGAGSNNGGGSNDGEETLDLTVDEIVKNVADNSSIVKATFNGHVAVIVDEDGDGVYETILVDINDNGNLDEHEILDFSEFGLTFDRVVEETGLEVTYINGSASEDDEDIEPTPEPEPVGEEIFEEDIEISDEDALDI